MLPQKQYLRLINQPTNRKKSITAIELEQGLFFLLLRYHVPGMILTLLRDFQKKRESVCV